MQAERPPPGRAEDRPNRIPWPPLIYLGAAAAGYALHVALPLTWIDGLFGTGLFWVGLLIMAAALATDIYALLMFRRHKTTILPHRGATHLITAGPFAWSRNPIYVSYTALLFGAGLAFGMAWLCILAPGAALLTQKLAIEAEELHLERRFGRAWQVYAAKVPRWLW